MEQLQIVADLWRMALRRLPLIATVAFLGVFATVFLIYVLPEKYQAQARILVERQQIPDSLARSTVTSGVAERLQQIQTRMLARDNIIRLIETQGLFTGRQDLRLSEKIDQVRWAIQFQTIEAPRASRHQNVDVAAFNIMVTYTNPRKAADAANELATQVLALNLADRTGLATETLDFFNREEKRLGDALAAIESDITQFKKDNEERLPDSLEYRRSELSRLADNAIDIDKRVLELQEQRGELATELSEVGNTTPPPQSSEEAELRRLEALLAQKQAVFADGHREVRALKAQIAAVRDSLPAVPANVPGSDTRSVREQSLRDRIALIETQVSALEDQKEEIEKRRAEIEGTIEETPKIEMRLNVLARRHKELQDQYAAIVAKRAEAETGERLEVNQQSERFEVIENALVPEKPISPNRKKIAMMGSAGSLGLAFALAFLFDLMRPAIRSASQMERQLELRPVVAIPRITTRRDRIRGRLKAVFWLLFLGVAIPGALYLVDQHVMPLALIADKIVEKTGLGDILRLIEARF